MAGSYNNNNGRWELNDKFWNCDPDDTPFKRLYGGGSLLSYGGPPPYRHDPVPASALVPPLTPAANDGSCNYMPNIMRCQERKMFIGGLSWTTTERELFDHFVQFGGIERVSIKIDPHTGRSRGFGFIVFADPVSLERVSYFGNHIINNKRVDPKKAKARRGKIFVGGLVNEITDDDIFAYFGQFGIIVDIEMPFDKLRNQRKGFCFITFESDTVVYELLRTPKQKIRGHCIDVKRATPRPENQIMIIRNNRIVNAGSYGNIPPVSTSSGSYPYVAGLGTLESKANANNDNGAAAPTAASGFYMKAQSSDPYNTTAFTYYNTSLFNAETGTYDIVPSYAVNSGSSNQDSDSPYTSNSVSRCSFYPQTSTSQSTNSCGDYGLFSPDDRANASVDMARSANAAAINVNNSNEGACAVPVPSVVPVVPVDPADVTLVASDDSVASDDNLNPIESDTSVGSGDTDTPQDNADQEPENSFDLVAACDTAIKLDPVASEASVTLIVPPKPATPFDTVATLDPEATLDPVINLDQVNPVADDISLTPDDFVKPVTEDASPTPVAPSTTESHEASVTPTSVTAETAETAETADIPITPEASVNPVADDISLTPDDFVKPVTEDASPTPVAPSTTESHEASVTPTSVTAETAETAETADIPITPEASVDPVASLAPVAPVAAVASEAPVSPQAPDAVITTVRSLSDIARDKWNLFKETHL